MEFGETLVAITAILLAGGVIMIGMLGIAVRFSFKPAMEAWSSIRNGSGSEQTQRLLLQRVALLEEQVRQLERENSRLVEDVDFNLKLRS